MLLKISKATKRAWQNPQTKQLFLNNIIKASKKRQKRIICLETNKIYESVSAAGKDNGMTARDVSNSAIKIFCRKGLSFRFIDNEDNIIPPLKEKNKRSKPKGVICLENGFVYDSQEDAAKQLKIKGGSSSVSRQAHGIRKKAGGYTFQFI